MIKSLVVQSKHIILIDIIAFCLIFYFPALSHATSLPLYILEPFRIVILFCMIIMEDKKNAYFLAFALPLFSFFVSGHPVALKMMIMSVELITNVWLYYKLFIRIKSVFFSLLLSIALSKFLYYLLKF